MILVALPVILAFLSGALFAIWKDHEEKKAYARLGNPSGISNPDHRGDRRGV